MLFSELFYFQYSIISIHKISANVTLFKLMNKKISQKGQLLPFLENTETYSSNSVAHSATHLAELRSANGGTSLCDVTGAAVIF